MATGGLVVLWLIVLAAAFLARFSPLEADSFMPPMERLVFALTLLILAWAFISADFERWQNRSNLLVFAATLGLALLYVGSARGWLGLYDGGAVFNATEPARLWAGVTAGLAGFGFLLALVNYRRIVDAPLKILFFLIFVAGNGWDLYQMSAGGGVGNYSGATRLAYLAGLLLLPLIIYRLAIALLEHSLVEVVLAASQPSSAITPAPEADQAPAGDEVDALLAAPSSWNFSASPAPTDRRHLLNAIGIMLERRDDARIGEQIVKAALESLQVEVCALLRVQENEYADVIAGYDQVAEQSLGSLSLNLNEQATLREAATRREQTILFPEYHADELKDLFRRLNIQSVCSVYAQPLTADGELAAIMLVASPYRQADLTPGELDALRDIGFVAGNLLAWSDDAASSRVESVENVIDDIAERTAEAAVDRETLEAHRQDLEASLARVKERSLRMARQIAELQRQQQEQHVRLLEALAEGENGQETARRLNATLDENAELRQTTAASARALLDAETILRVLAAGDGDALAQIIREHLHKEYNLLLTTRDRLRQHINALLVMGRSATAEGLTAILGALADESAQLELEREQQKRRLDSITNRLESLGVDGEVATMTQLMIQLYAERKTLTQHLAMANQDRRTLLDERRRLLETESGDSEALESQLKRLNADHEQLLNSREELRREQQDLQSRIEQAQSENVDLQARSQALEAEIAARDERQQEAQRQIDALEEERDNLLEIRDQLTARVNTMLDAGPDQETEASRDREIAELQAQIRRLTDQREELALDLSDARVNLSARRESMPEAEADAQAATQVHRHYASEVFTSMLGNMRAPMTSISDYTDLLLAESIGILGAAQRQVLSLIAADISRLSHTIAEIQQMTAREDARFSLEHGAIDLVSIIEEAIDEATELGSAKGHLVELALDEPLPPLYVNGASLQHIIARLVANAGAVSPAGSQITVSALVGPVLLPGAAETVDACEIRVSDMGGGISANDARRIFARIYRAENRAIPGYGDSGVGLSVARAFARAQNGDLWITSEAGKGSVFHLALPLQLAASIED